MAGCTIGLSCLEMSSQVQPSWETKYALLSNINDGPYLVGRPHMLANTPTNVYYGLLVQTCTYSCHFSSGSHRLAQHIVLAYHGIRLQKINLVDYWTSGLLYARLSHYQNKLTKKTTMTLNACKKYDYAQFLHASYFVHNHLFDSSNKGTSIMLSTEFLFRSFFYSDSHPKWFGTHYNLEVLV